MSLQFRVLGSIAVLLVLSLLCGGALLILHARSVVLEARPMESKPHVGLLRTRWEVINQHNEDVMQMEGYGMFRRRPKATAA